MKIGMGKFLADGLSLEGVEKALRRVTAAITTGFAREHREDGTHTDVTADSLTVAAGENGEGTIGSSLMPNTTNTYDLGGPSAEQNNPIYAWRNAYVGENLYGGATTNALGDAVPVWTDSIGSGTRVIRINSGSTANTLTIGRSGRDWVVFGGVTGWDLTTGSISCTSLTNSGSMSSTQLVLTDGITAPSATVGFAKIYVDTADGDLKVIFGDGVIKTLATDT